VPSTSGRPNVSAARQVPLSWAESQSIAGLNGLVYPTLAQTAENGLRKLPELAAEIYASMRPQARQRNARAGVRASHRGVNPGRPAPWLSLLEESGNGRFPCIAATAQQTALRTGAKENRCSGDGP
jgi:hypothetical protein